MHSALEQYLRLHDSMHVVSIAQLSQRKIPTCASRRDS